MTKAKGKKMKSTFTVPKFIKEMLPALAGGAVGLLILIGIQGNSLSDWFEDRPEAIQKANFQSYFVDVNKETQIIMFGTKWCQYCAKAREYFSQNNISFIDRDVESSQDSMNLFNQLQGQSYPLVLSRGVKIAGFDKSVYDELLKPNESLIEIEYRQR
jgi:glutaredoxin